MPEPLFLLVVVVVVVLALSLLSCVVAHPVATNVTKQLQSFAQTNKQTEGWRVHCHAQSAFDTPPCRYVLYPSSELFFIICFIVLQ